MFGGQGHEVDGGGGSAGQLGLDLSAVGKGPLRSLDHVAIAPHRIGSS
jgi:hypothetical protein